MDLTKFNEAYIHQYLTMLNDYGVKMNYGPVKKEEKHPLEQIYIYNIFTNLSKWSGFKNYEYFVIGSTQPWDYTFNEKSIVFYMSNEDHTLDDRLKTAFKVFTPYCPLDNKPANVFPIPLGYNGSLSDKQIVPVNERVNDVFFSGNIHRRRLFYFLASKIYLFLSQYYGQKVVNRFYFTRKFTGVLTPEEYADLLMNSKIALVPEGYISNNSFRFFEATKYGTIVITAPLYKYWFYENFPGIQLKSWFSMNKEIKRLLKNPGALNEMQTNIIAFYQNNCSERAVADFIITTIDI